MTAPVVGIDLGTTNSLVAVMRDGRPVVLPNALGEQLTPSAVHLGEDGVLHVGAVAKARYALAPERTACWFKRDMGTNAAYTLGDRRFSATELSAMVLAQLKRDAEAALGATVEEAVVTVPAYFGEKQRQATRDAAAIAGLKAERIVNEPTAAALAYGLHERGRELKIAVVDLGGGTFDVTILQVLEGVIEIQSTSGDVRLGGEDFVDVIRQDVVARLAAQHGVDARRLPLAWARITEACERAKCRLSAEDASRVLVPELDLGRHKLDLEIALTRAEFERLCLPVMERLRAPIVRALADARLTPAAIDEILLVGGATRMPSVARLVAQIFGRVPLRALSPDLAIAQGAAVQAALKSGDASVEDLIVTDVAPFTLGIETVEQHGIVMIHDVFTPILERGTVIPTSRIKQFSSATDWQESINVRVFQGEHHTCARNQHLRDISIPVPKGPAGAESVDVRFTYDLNGLLEVDVTAVSSGEHRAVLLEGAPGKLTADQIARARQAMQALKHDPREALPNTAAIARAEALYAELTGDARQAVGHAIVGLRMALERQDGPQIDLARAQLVAITERLAIHG